MSKNRNKAAVMTVGLVLSAMLTSAGHAWASPPDAGVIGTVDGRNLCITRPAGEGRAGDPVTAGTCRAGDPRQAWSIDDATIRPASGPALCLTASGMENYGTFTLAACAAKARPAQQWRYLGDQGAFASGKWQIDLTHAGELIVWERHSGTQHLWMSSADAMARVKHAASTRVRFPIRYDDHAALALEDARAFVNRLAPIDQPLPAPRDVSGFPGVVSGSAPRVSEKLALDRRYVPFADGGWQQNKLNWLATNLYAPAGEVVTVTVETHDPAAARDVYLRIGAHTDEITPDADKPLERFRSVSEIFPLKPGVNKIRSQYGGSVILESHANANVTLPVTVAGAVKAPYFRLGRDSAATWATAKNAPAPWAVLEGERSVVIVPAAQARAQSDPGKALAIYDKVITLTEDFYGFDGHGASNPRLKNKQWFVEDKQISAGYAHAGDPIMTYDDWDLASLEGAMSWGVFHEVGHNYQQFCLWQERFGTEATVNLSAAYVQEMLTGSYRFVTEKTFSDAIAALKKPGFDFDRDADDWHKPMLFLQLRHAFPDKGWDILRQFHRRLRAMTAKKQATTCASEQAATDNTYEMLSEITGHDLREHFAHWGVKLSPQALARVKAKGLSVPKIQTWWVNPES